MADVEISYNNSVIASLSAAGSEVLETNQTFLTDDITVTYAGGGGGGGVTTVTVGFPLSSLASSAMVYYCDKDWVLHTDAPNDPFSGFVDNWTADVPVGALIVLKNGNTSIPASGTHLTKVSNLANTTNYRIAIYEATS